MKRMEIFLLIAFLVVLTFFESVNAQVSVVADYNKINTTNTLSLAVHQEGIPNDPNFWNLLKDANVKLVRLFDNSQYISPLVSWDNVTHTGVYDWTNWDRVLGNYTDHGFDILLTIGHSDWYSQWISEAYKNMTNYTTGLGNLLDYTQYAKDITQHNKDKGFNVKYVEIWNEPPIEVWGEPPSKRPERANNIVNLYNFAAPEIKAIDSSLKLGLNYFDNQYIFNASLENLTFSLDFGSFHRYNANGLCMYPYNKSNVNNDYYPPNDKNGWFNNDTIMNLSDLILGHEYISEAIVPGRKLFTPNYIRDTWYAEKGYNIEYFDSESNLNSAFKNGTDPRQQTVFAAAWLANVYRKHIEENIPYLTYFVFLNCEETNPMSQAGFKVYGFGMTTIYPCAIDGSVTPLYPYYTMKLFGSNLKPGYGVYASSSSNTTEVQTIAFKNSTHYNLILIGKVNKDVPVSVQFSGIVEPDDVKMSTIDGSYEGIVETSIPYSNPLSMTLDGYSVVLLQIPIKSQPPWPGACVWWGAFEEFQPQIWNTLEDLGVNTVRVGGFHVTFDWKPQTKNMTFEAFDQFLENASTHNIKVIPFVADLVVSLSNSTNYTEIEPYIEEVAQRYKNDDRILYWVVGGDLNLANSTIVDFIRNVSSIFKKHGVKQGLGLAGWYYKNATMETGRWHSPYDFLDIVGDYLDVYTVSIYPWGGGTGTLPDDLSLIEIDAYNLYKSNISYHKSVIGSRYSRFYVQEYGVVRQSDGVYTGEDKEAAFYKGALEAIRDSNVDGAFFYALHPEPPSKLDSFSPIEDDLSWRKAAYTIQEYYTGIKQLPWLHTDGKWIKDSDGNIVFLHGANYMGYEFGSYGFTNHTESDYEKMSKWGFKVVRLPLSWHFLEPQPGVYNDTYLAYLDRDIQWAKKYGMYIIPDFHFGGWSPYFYSFEPSGLPEWAVSSYPQDETGGRMSIEDFWLGKGPNGTDASPTNPSMQDRFIELWKYMASRYKDESTIAGYDLMNEPPRQTVTMTIDEVASHLYPMYLNLIDNISAIDPNHIIIYEPVGGWHSKSAQNLSRDNLAFSFHFYSHNGVAGRDNYTENITEIETDLVYHLNQPSGNPIKDWNIPIYIGEFGTTIFAANHSSWTRDVLSLFEKYSLNYWTWWQFWKTDGGQYSLLYANGTEKTSLVKHLNRPYPVSSVVPITNTSFYIDTKRFSTVMDCVGEYTIKYYVPNKPTRITQDGNLIPRDDTLTLTPSWKYEDNSVTVKFAC